MLAVVVNLVIAKPRSATLFSRPVLKTDPVRVVVDASLEERDEDQL
jgi:hypothetical protein